MAGAMNSNRTALLFELEHCITIWTQNNTIAAINAAVKQCDSVL